MSAALAAARGAGGRWCLRMPSDHRLGEIERMSEVVRLRVDAFDHRIVPVDFACEGFIWFTSLTRRFRRLEGALVAS